MFTTTSTKLIIVAWVLSFSLPVTYDLRDARCRLFFYLSITFSDSRPLITICRNNTGSVDHRLIQRATAPPFAAGIELKVL